MKDQRINKGIRFWGIPGQPAIEAGVGTPQGVLGSSPGTIFIQTDGADADHLIWYKNSAVGTKTGWVNITTSALTGASLVLTGAGLTSPNTPKVAKVALAAVDTGGGVFSWANPEAVTVIVTSVVLDVTTIATGACTVEVGTTSASGTTVASNLIAAADVHTGAGLFKAVAGSNTAGVGVGKIATGKWVTGSTASGASAGLVGSAYIEYIFA